MKPRSPRPIAFILTASNHGTMILNHNDRYTLNPGGNFGVGWEILASSYHEQQEIDQVSEFLLAKRQLAGDGVVVVDCGANIGTHTVEWARFMYGWGQVIAIEAQEYIYYALAGNIALNNCFNAHAMWAAVGAQPGTMRVPIIDYHKNGSYGSLELKPSPTNKNIGQNISYADDNESCNIV